MKTIFKTIILALTGTLMVAETVSADTLSLSDTTSAPVGYFSVKPNAPTNSYAMYASFTIGNASYLLSSISALVTPSFGQTYSATISSGTIGNVVSTLTTVNGSSVSFGVPSTFNDLSSITLSANTTYWIGLSCSNPGGFWAYTDLANLVVTSDIYGTTINPGLFDSAGTSFPAFTPIFSVQAVPEPSTLALVGLGALSSLVLRRKKA